MPLIIKILTIVYLICQPTIVTAECKIERNGPQECKETVKKETISFARTNTYRATNCEIFAALTILLLASLAVKWLFFPTPKKIEFQCPVARPDCPTMDTGDCLPDDDDFDCQEDAECSDSYSWDEDGCSEEPSQATNSKAKITVSATKRRNASDLGGGDAWVGTGVKLDAKDELFHSLTQRILLTDTQPLHSRKIFTVAWATVSRDEPEEGEDPGGEGEGEGEGEKESAETDEAGGEGEKGDEEEAPEGETADGAPGEEGTEGEGADKEGEDKEGAKGEEGEDKEGAEDTEKDGADGAGDVTEGAAEGEGSGEGAAEEGAGENKEDAETEAGKGEVDQKSAEQKDPCADLLAKKDDDPCAGLMSKEDKDPCANLSAKEEDPCAQFKSKSEDPCAKYKGDKAKDPCARFKSKENRDPCANISQGGGYGREDSWAVTMGRDRSSSRQGQDPCAGVRDRSSSRQGQDPCAGVRDSSSSRQRQDSCAGVRDRGRSLNRQSEDPDAGSRDRARSLGQSRGDPYASETERTRSLSQRREGSGAVGGQRMSFRDSNAAAWDGEGATGGRKPCDAQKEKEPCCQDRRLPPPEDMGQEDRLKDILDTKTCYDIERERLEKERSDTWQKRMATAEEGLKFLRTRVHELEEFVQENSDDKWDAQRGKSLDHISKGDRYSSRGNGRNGGDCFRDRPKSADRARTSYNRGGNSSCPVHEGNASHGGTQIRPSRFANGLGVDNGERARSLSPNMRPATTQYYPSKMSNQRPSTMPDYRGMNSQNGSSGFQRGSMSQRQTMSGYGSGSMNECDNFMSSQSGGSMDTCSHGMNGGQSNPCENFSCNSNYGPKGQNGYNGGTSGSSCDNFTSGANGYQQNGQYGSSSKDHYMRNGNGCNGAKQSNPCDRFKNQNPCDKFKNQKDSNPCDKFKTQNPCDKFKTQNPCDKFKSQKDSNPCDKFKTQNPCDKFKSQKDSNPCDKFKNKSNGNNGYSNGCNGGSPNMNDNYMYNSNGGSRNQSCMNGGRTNQCGNYMNNSNNGGYRRQSGGTNLNCDRTMGGRSSGAGNQGRSSSPNYASGQTGERRSSYMSSFNSGPGSSRMGTTPNLPAGPGNGAGGRSSYSNGRRSYGMNSFGSTGGRQSLMSSTNSRQSSMPGQSEQSTCFPSLADPNKGKTPDCLKSKSKEKFESMCPGMSCPEEEPQEEESDCSHCLGSGQTKKPPGRYCCLCHHFHQGE